MTFILLSIARGCPEVKICLAVAAECQQPFLSGIVSFGGGKTFIPIFEKFYVDDFPIVTSLKLAEIIGLSLALPGPMSPMVAGFVGYEEYGIIGFILGMIMLCVPPVILLYS